MSDQDKNQRSILPIPDRQHVGLTTYDAKDPDTKYSPIRELRPPAGGGGFEHFYGFIWLIAQVAALLLIAPMPASAQPVPIPDTWGGDFGSRPRLTGSWGGLRDELGKKGIVLDLDLLLTPQGVVSGGRDNKGAFWGNAEYTLNVDTGKAGLWPGGFLRVVGGSSFGDHVLAASGALLPVNVSTLVPKPLHPATDLQQATFMQFLSPKFGLIAGKFFNVDGFQGEFNGNYRTQFMNLGVAFPMASALAPLVAYGAGIVALPWEGVTLSLLVQDPNGNTTGSDVTEAFKDGVMLLGGAHVAVKPFGLVGHQGVSFIWSNKERLSLEQDPSNIARLLLTERFPLLGDPGPVLKEILDRFFPGIVPVQPPNRESDTWTVIYSFDQYLWQPAGDPTRGIGVFFTFGASDGKANPIKYSYSLGIGGKGIVPGRPRDTFGLGWGRTQFSDDFVPFLRKQLHLGLDKEDAFEMYYNASITSWLNATLDLQVVDSALNKKLDSSSGRLTNMNTAVVIGGRVYIRF
jgi:porin